MVQPRGPDFSGGTVTFRHRSAAPPQAAPTSMGVPDMKRLLLIPALLCAALAGNAFAGDAGADRQAKREQWCKDNPAKCEEVKARKEKFCKENPETCKQRKAAREKRQAWCDKNPAECQKI